MVSFLLIVIALVARCQFCLASSPIKGGFNVPYTASMRLGYFFNSDDMTSDSNSPFTEAARDGYTTVKHERTSFLYKIVSSSQEKRDLLDISGSLSLKIKALGGIDIAASGSYLKETGNGNKFVELLAVMKIEKMTKTLTGESEKIENYMDDLKNAASRGNYHYVRSVTYGGELVASIKFTSTSDKSIEDIQAKASLAVESATVDVSVSGQFKKLAEDMSSSSEFEATVFITGGKEGIVVGSIEDLNKQMSAFIRDMQDDSNAAATRASLLPIEHLVPTDKVFQGIQFIMDRSLEVSTAKFEEYFDDILVADKIFQDIFNIEREQPNKYRFNQEDTETKERVYSELGSLRTNFTKAIRTMRLNQVTSSTENRQLLASSIQKYNSYETGHLPGKYVRAARELRDILKKVTVEGNVPGLLLAQLNNYYEVVYKNINTKIDTVQPKIRCVYQKLTSETRPTNALVDRATSSSSTTLPGFAMNVYAVKGDVTPNTPINYEVSTPTAFNDQFSVPATSTLKDYYLDHVIGGKRGLAHLIAKKKRARKIRKMRKAWRDANVESDSETEVALYKNNALEAPMDGLYLMSYQLTNTGTVTEVVEPESKCDASWKSFNVHCYKVIADVKTFPNARQHCQNLGGDLVSIHTTEEETFVSGLSGVSSYNHWIGLQRSGSTWAWTDGTNYEDRNKWAGSEPNNAGGNENCVEMYGSMYMNDLSCSQQRMYICKKEAKKQIESAGQVRVKVKKGDMDLSEETSQSESSDLSKKCDQPFRNMPMSKPVLTRLVTGDRVHIEQTTEGKINDVKEIFFNGVFLSG